MSFRSLTSLAVLTKEGLFRELICLPIHRASLSLPGRRLTLVLRMMPLFRE